MPVSSEPRRPLGEPDRREKIPVLFHLADVSRPRKSSHRPQNSVAEGERPPVVEPAAALTSPIQAESFIEQPAVAFESVARAFASSEIAPTPTPPSPNRSSRTFRTPATEAWFASNGKFIAIAFLIALAGTVYLARTSRRREPVATASRFPTPGAERRSTPASVDDNHAATNSTVATEAPANKKNESGSAASPATELYAPVATLQAKDNLFVFPPNAKEEPRVANRSGAPPLEQAAPELHAPAPPPTSPAPELTPSYPTTASPAPSPAITAPYQNSYPVTPAPPILESPVAAGPPAFAAPSMPPGYGPPGFGGPNSAIQYRSPYLPAGQAMQQPLPQQPMQQSMMTPGPESPPPYSPLDNTARGPRYERTGSGHY